MSANLLEQNSTTSAPDEKWVRDLSYLWSDEGWLYLAAVLDLNSRKVIGWAMHRRMKGQLVCDVLTMAMWRRLPSPSLFVHSDRGSQHCLQKYQRLLESSGAALLDERERQLLRQRDG